MKKLLSLTALVLCFATAAYAVDVTFGNVNVNGTLTCRGGTVGCGGGGGGGGSPDFPSYTVATLPACTPILNPKSANIIDSLNTCGAGNAIVGGGTGNICSVVCDGVNAWRIVGTAPTAVYLQAANNLSDVQSAPSSRTNLGLGAVATQSLVPYTLGGTGDIYGPGNSIEPYYECRLPTGHWRVLAR